MTTFQEKVKALRAHHEELLSRKNEPVEWGNGIYEKYKNPILTAEHTPLEWRYDFDEKSNPYLMQRIMMRCIRYGLLFSSKSYRHSSGVCSAVRIGFLYFS